MTNTDAALASQVRNIEATYNRTMAQWFTIIDGSRLSKHPDVIALLKDQYGITHGAAHRISLLYRQHTTPAPTGDPVDLLFAGKKAHLIPIHDALVAYAESLGDDVDLVPKKGYLSLVRDKQFAMIQPTTTTRVDLGLILKATAPTPRLEDAAKFNALFTHRVRLASTNDIDTEVHTWLQRAYQQSAR
jgi:Domain of unknown function (DUF5655)/Domain of unknown function (DUF4287)